MERETMIMAARKYGYTGPDWPERDSEQERELGAALGRAERNPRQRPFPVGFEEFIDHVRSGRIEIDTEGI